jgi:hypothetical protein
MIKKKMIKVRKKKMKKEKGNLYVDVVVDGCDDDVVVEEKWIKIRY